MTAKSETDSNFYTGIIDSWHSFFTYIALGSLIADGVIKGRLPNSVILMKMFGTELHQLNDALEKLGGEKVIELKSRRFLGESSGAVLSRRIPLNHRVSPT